MTMSSVIFPVHLQTLLSLNDSITDKLQVADSSY